MQSFKQITALFKIQNKTMAYSKSFRKMKEFCTWQPPYFCWYVYILESSWRNSRGRKANQGMNQRCWRPWLSRTLTNREWLGWHPSRRTEKRSVRNIFVSLNFCPNLGLTFECCCEFLHSQFFFPTFKFYLAAFKGLTYPLNLFSLCEAFNFQPSRSFDMEGISFGAKEATKFQHCSLVKSF